MNGESIKWSIRSLHPICLKHNAEINNSIARKITGIGSENEVKRHFISLGKRNLIERVPDKGGSKASWRMKSR